MIITDHYSCLELDINGTKFSVYYMHATGYSLAHNRIPVVPFISIDNPEDNTVELPAGEITIHASVEETQLFSTAPIKFQALPPNRAFSRELHEETRVPISKTLESTESRPGELEVTVRIGEQVFTQSADLQILAPNEWFNSPAFFESLAAFVQPNGVESNDILRKASDILRTRTGDASLCGYQQGSQRAIAIAGAVYEALQQWDIRYINPPASFENTGQRIRSSSDVLRNRFGTCIDLSLTFAAVAEECGLRPVIIIVPGHALAGILTSDSPLGMPVEFNPSVINNYLRSGRIMPIDASFYEAQSFNEVVTESRTRYIDTPVYGIIDVVASHKDGIRPLPSMTDSVPSPEVALATSISDLGTSSQNNDQGKPSKDWSLPSVGLQKDALHSANTLTIVDDSPIRIQKWKRELLDLSLRNRLLNMRNNAEVLEFHLPEGTLADLDDKIHAGERISIHPRDEVSENRQLQGITNVGQLPLEQQIENLVKHNRLYADVTDASYTRYFRKLNRQVRTYLEETGSANLYLTLGALQHTTSSEALAQAPLFLIPVKIVGGRGKARFQIQVDSTQEASPNYCLVEWFKQKHNVTIDALSSPRLDASGLDIAYALSAISNALIEAKLPFTVIENARLIIARFSTYGMWKDLRDSWRTFMEAPVFKHLVTDAGSVFSDPAGDTPIDDIVVDEKELTLPIPADGTQMKAISAAAAGRSFVLQGPPGTGKSQTITNLIAHALSQGKTILFVAEKQAALEVVQSRLSKVGLSPFTLNLHGTEQSPRAIKRQLKDSIDAEVFYDFTSWTTAVSNLQSRLTPLVKYPSQIHDKNGAGYSLWSAASALSNLGEGPVASISEAFAAHPPVSLETLRIQVADVSVRAGFTDFSAVSCWKLAGPNMTSSSSEFNSAWDALEEFRPVVLSSQVLQDFLARPNLNRELENLYEVSNIPVEYRLDDVQQQTYSASAARLKSLAEEVNRFHQEVGPALQVFSQAFIENGDPTPLLTAITDTRSGFFGKRKKLSHYEQLLRAAVRPEIRNLETDAQHCPKNIEPLLLQIPQLRAAAQKFVRDLRDVPGAEPLQNRSAFDPSLPHDLWETGQRLQEATETSKKHAATLRLYTELSAEVSNSTTPTHEGSLVDTLSQVFTAWQRWLEVLDVSASTLENWRQSQNWVQAWLSYADEWARDISERGLEDPSRASQWISSTQPLLEAGLEDFVSEIESGEIQKNDIVAAFDRGLARASVTERSFHFLLRDFHPSLKEEELNQLNHALSRVREEAQKAIPAKLLKRRSYEPGKLTGRAAELRRKLESKRNSSSFRTLLKEYGNEILSIAPCFFVSPASLATFVAPGAVTFDIVVFDEASQVTVDQAVGALGRGKSAVIVGDSHQMPPTRIGKATTDNLGDFDDEDTDASPMANVDDLESILTEADESGFPQVWLSWHYRSKDESLIAFSNNNYYEGKLSSLPSPGHIQGAGVHVRRLPGQFIRDRKKGALRTNPVEAQAIVESVVRRVNSPLTRHESIGVVTFNIQQRDLIIDLLEQCGDPLVSSKLAPGPDNIFVKNLENVQGDERDTILFSTAFSKFEDGKPMPMNFGPLTRNGGERRLNVAITRARKEVEVFCSFDPSEIDLTRTKSVGMRHLRGYLEAGIANDSLATMKQADHLGINDNQLRDIIADRLQERGWIVEKDYGQSAYTLDLVVRPSADSRWHAAILTDSEKWAKMPTVADRDLTPSLLEKIMEWGAAIRVWLPEWIADSDAALTRIEQELKAAGERIHQQDACREKAIAEATRHLENEKRRLEEAQLAEKDALMRAKDELPASELKDDTAIQERAEQLLKPDNSSLETDIHEASVHWATESSDASEVTSNHLTSAIATPVVEEADAEASPECPTAVPYVGLPTDRLGHREELEAGFSSIRVRELEDEMRKVIAECGPVTLQALRTNFAQRFGRHRTSTLINVRSIDPLIPAELIHTDPVSKVQFVWPTANGATSWPHYRSSTGRTISDIPIEEITNVAKVIVRRQPELLLELPENPETIGRQILKVFGISRYTKAAQERTNAAIAALEEPAQP